MKLTLSNISDMAITVASQNAIRMRKWLNALDRIEGRRSTATIKTEICF